MWIVTDKGFFSFVVDKKDSNYLWLRARVREDLARNFPDAEIIEKPGADYLFRARVTREHVAKVMTEQIMAADIQGHFKDVAISRSAKPTHGSRSSAMYAFWTAMAALQPYAPYSKVPRPEPKPFVSNSRGGSWRPGDRTVGTGQTALPSSGRGSEDRGLYGGLGGGHRASEFDWDSRSWGGGDSAPDPVRGGQVAPEFIDASLDEDQAWWDALSDEERDEYLNEAEAEARAVDAGEIRPVQVVTVSPDPVNRPGTRRKTRKTRKERRRERQNRHNQEGTTGRRAERNREGLNGEEARNRQGYLDRQAKLKGE